MGSAHNITWNATDNVGVTSIDVSYSKTGAGGPFAAIAIGEPNDGVYSWTVPNDPTTNAFAKVVAYDAATNNGQDISNAAFTITACVEVEVGDLAVPLNGLRTPADVVTLINVVFKSKPLPEGVNPCAADINKSGGPPSPADVVTLINNVFRSRSLPLGETCGC